MGSLCCHAANVKKAVPPGSVACRWNSSFPQSKFGAPETPETPETPEAPALAL
ncbi:hypothetical protein [Cohnella massiliensis]|uniref:hypothetical protein n=1 Tax=Cohnella massiliensis TaxID=1816691 RepID=UPI0015947931|nr:hypothetical protein [Cohnella massiliensis]